MPPFDKKQWKKMQGNVHTSTLGRLTGAQLPGEMYPGTTKRITTTTLGTGANLPGSVYVEGRGSINGIRTPRGNEVRAPKRGRLNRFK